MKYADLKQKQLKIAYIRNKLGNDIRWATRGVLRIFENQTQDEQNTDQVIEQNGVGFNGVDAEILSSFAKQILNGRNLTQKQNAILLKAMPKYAKQLYQIANAKEAEELLKKIESARKTIQYYECAEGNWINEAADRERAYEHLNSLFEYAEREGIEI